MHFTLTHYLFVIGIACYSTINNIILLLVKMDPALLREREAFKKRALSNPVIESKKKDVSESQKKKPKSASTPKPPKGKI